MAIGRRKRGGAGNTEVPMGPMIDIVFLLLIYFIVTFKQITPEAHIAVNLPSPSAAESDKQPQLLELVIMPGEYRLRNKPLSLPRIRRSLQTFAENNPEVTVIIKMSVYAPTKQLVKVLDACKAADLKNLNVLALE